MPRNPADCFMYYTMTDVHCGNMWQAVRTISINDNVAYIAKMCDQRVENLSVTVWK